MAPFKITKCTKLRWFQTCINHKILATNKFLYQIKTVDSPNCSFCSTNEESIEHLFLKYSKTQQFLKKVTEKFQEISISLNLNERNLIIPPANFVCRGYTVFTLSVRPSVHPSVRNALFP